MPSRLLPRIAVLLALASLVMACTAAGSGQVIDGWPIGDRLDCSDSECTGYMPVAALGLDRRDPGHGAIVDSILYRQGPYLHEDGSTGMDVCSGGCPAVAVFRLLDGSIRAIGVGTPGISTEPMAFDWGPLFDWQRPAAR